MHKTLIEPALADLPERIGRTPVVPGGTIQVGRDVTLEHLEAEHIHRLMIGTVGLEEAAGILRVDPCTLYCKRKRLGP